jgi:hypothetical protein
MLKRIWGGNGPAGMCIEWMTRNLLSELAAYGDRGPPQLAEA